MIPCEEFRELLEGARIEIGSGMVMFPKSTEERAYNAACQRALDIIENYRAGNGLFQLTRGRKAKGRTDGR